MADSTTSSRSTTTRRRFLQQMAAVGSGAALLGRYSLAEASAGGDNPFGIDPSGDLDVFIFDGGFGDVYATDVHQPLFAARWPDVNITHQADPDVSGVLQTRFVTGDPPDVVNNSGGQRIDPAVLVANDQLYDLTELFDAPSWDDPSVTVRDTLVPGTIESGLFGPNPYILNYTYTIYGLWYDQRLFDEHGWTAPTTWAEMLDLCAEIEGVGVAPFTYQGGSPRYVNWTILAMAAKAAGREILIDIDNLVPGAWEHDAIRAAAEAVSGLRAAGYILEGTEGMDHVQAQAAWARGRAAIVGCGSWLENENADDIADNEGFDMAMMPVPLLEESSALPAETIRATAGEPFVVPAQAASPQMGLEYLRAMLSLEGARGFTEHTSSLTAVAGSAEGVELPPGLTSAVQALDAAGDNIINWFYPGWYGSMENPGIDAYTGDLMAGRIDVDEWVAGAESEAARIRDDDTIEKFTREA